MGKDTVWNVIKIFAVIGIVLALYLLWQLFFTPSIKPCNINATVNCDALTSGPLAYTLGVPTALYGLAGYILILVAAFIKAKKLLFGVALFGLAFCLRIAYIELFQLKVICPVCIGCQVDMITVFILSVLLLRKKQEGPAAAA